MMRSVAVWSCMALVACGPAVGTLPATSVEKLSIKSQGGAICGTPGLQTQLVVTATTKDGTKLRTALGDKTDGRLDPGTFKYKASVGTIARKTATYETPAEILQLLEPVIVTAYHAESKDVTATRELDVRFDCETALDVRDGKKVKVHVGWLDTQRAGRLALTRVTRGKDEWWYLLDPKGPGLALDARGSDGTQVLAEDDKAAALIAIKADDDDEGERVKIVPSPTEELVSAAGGMPEEQAAASEPAEEAAPATDGVTTYEGTMVVTLTPKRGKPTVKTLKLRGLVSPTDEGHRFELDAGCLIEMTAESKTKGFVFGAKCEAAGLRMVQLDGTYKIKGETFRLGLEGKTDNGTVEMSFESAP